MGHSNLNPIQVNAIVIGSGITGSLLTYLLTKKQTSVFLIDRGQEDSSSSVAAGIMNPVTGKNFVKSWGIDTFLPKANEIYQQWEIDYGEQILYPLNIVRKLPNAGAENAWESRKLDPGYSKYIEPHPNQHLWENKLKTKGLYAEIKGSMRVDIRTLIQKVKKQQVENGLGLNENFEYNMLKRENNYWHYKNIISQHIVFCEGAGGIHNPFFKNLPFALTKGYAVEIFSAQHGFEQMFKDEMFLVPIDTNKLWAGGAYSSLLSDKNKDESEFSKIDENLKEWYQLPFSLTNKRSAIRPTTKNRRPIILKHPEWNSMFFVNGMGTKGTSMAPLIAEYVAGYINRNNALEDFSSIDLIV